MLSFGIADLKAANFAEIGRLFCGFLYAAPAIETWEG